MFVTPTMTTISCLYATYLDRSLSFAKLRPRAVASYGRKEKATGVNAVCGGVRHETS